MAQGLTQDQERLKVSLWLLVLQPAAVPVRYCANGDPTYFEGVHPVYLEYLEEEKLFNRKWTKGLS